MAARCCDSAANVKALTTAQTAGADRSSARRPKVRIAVTHRGGACAAFPRPDGTGLGFPPLILALRKNISNVPGFILSPTQMKYANRELCCEQNKSLFFNYSSIYVLVVVVVKQYDLVVVVVVVVVAVIDLVVS